MIAALLAAAVAAVAAAAVAAPAGGASGPRGANVPHVDMSGWAPHRVERFMDELPAPDSPQWWVRLRDGIYGPGASVPADAMGRRKGHHHGRPHKGLAAAVPAVPPASDFLLYAGDREGLPASLRKYRVAEVEGASLFLIHKPAHGEGALIDEYDENARPFHSGQRLLVPVARRGEATSGRELEEEEEEEEPFEVDLDGVTPETYEATLRQFVDASVNQQGQPPQRYVGTGGHDSAQAYIASELQKMDGVRFARQTYHSDARGAHFEGTNVIGCLPGRSSAFVAIGGHTDTLPVPAAAGGGGDKAPSPGAMDDGTGVTAALMAFQALHGAAKSSTDGKLPATVCATFFDGEEEGLTGSQVVADYIKNGHGKEAGTFLGAVVSDMSTGFRADKIAEMEERTSNQRSLEEDDDRDAGWRHLSSDVKRRTTVAANTNNEGVHIDSDDQHPQFFDAFVQGSKNQAVQGEVYQSNAAIWNSDHKSFLRSGLPAVDICAANHRMYPFWHDSRDTMDLLDYTTGPEVVKTMVLGIRNLMKSYADADDEQVVTLADQLNKHAARSAEEAHGGASENMDWEEEKAADADAEDEEDGGAEDHATGDNDVDAEMEVGDETLLEDAELQLEEAVEEEAQGGEADTVPGVGAEAIQAEGRGLARELAALD